MSAVRKIIEPANAFEPVQDGRIYIEKINGPFLFRKRTGVRHLAANSACGNTAGGRSAKTKKRPGLSTRPPHQLNSSYATRRY